MKALHATEVCPRVAQGVFGCHNCKRRSALGKDFTAKCLRVAQAVLSAAAERQKCPCKGFTVYSKVCSLRPVPLVKALQSTAKCLRVAQAVLSAAAERQRCPCKGFTIYSKVPRSGASCVPYSQCPWSRLYSTVQYLLVAQAVQAVVGAAAESQKCPCKSFTVYSEVTQCRLCSVRQVHPWSRLYSKVRASGATCVRRLYSDLCAVHTQKKSVARWCYSSNLATFARCRSTALTLTAFVVLFESVRVCLLVRALCGSQQLSWRWWRCARTQAFELQQDAKL